MSKLKQKVKYKLGEKKIAALRKVLKVARIIKNVVCWALIAVLAVSIILFVITKISGGTPTIFGYSFHRIASGSMEPELEIDDVIVNKEVTDTSDIGIGDIITFQGDNRFDYRKVTHRVLVAPYDDGNGGVALVTKGDANPDDDGEISFSDVESKFVMKADILKKIYNFFFSQWGLIIFIALLLLIFFDEIMNIVKIAVNHTEQEETESITEIIERLQREQQEADENADRKKKGKSSGKKKQGKKSSKNKAKSGKKKNRSKAPESYYPGKKKKKKKSKKRKKR